MVAIVMSWVTGKLIFRIVYVSVALLYLLAKFGTLQIRPG